MTSTTPLVFSLREQIVDRLRNDILCGRLAEGQALSEITLVERFAVSRTPVREALQQLTHEGLLEMRPNAGVKVAKRPPDAIRELVIPIRRRVETFALQSYFHELTPDDFKQWGEILNRLRIACIAHDYAAIVEHDVEFHRSIVRRAGQRDLEGIWTSLLGRIRAHFLDTQKRNYKDPYDIYEEHYRIVKIFESGELEASVIALGNNIV